MSLLTRYVSDPKDDGTYVLWLGPEATNNLWKEIEALEASRTKLDTALRAIVESAQSPERRSDNMDYRNAVLDKDLLEAAVEALKS